MQAGGQGAAYVHYINIATTPPRHRKLLNEETYKVKIHILYDAK